MFSNLQEMLVAQYGPGIYLTNAGLDWSQTVEVEPNLRSRFSNLAHTPDRFITAEGVAHGEGALSMGIYDASFGNPDGYDGVFLFATTIKQPGTDRHVLPRQLAHIAPLIEHVASMEYALNGSTRDKYCGIMMRTLPLVDGVKQVSENDWHAHHILTPEYLGAKNRARFLEIDAATMESLPLLSTRIIQSEYLYSNLCGSLVQTQASPTPMDMLTADGVYALKKPPAHHRQVRDGEIVRSNSLVFHCAASPKPADIGKLRTLIFVGYTATRAMESRLEHRLVA